MKNLFLSCFLILSFTFVFGQQAEIGRVSSGLSSGNGAAIGELMLANVDLSVAGNDDVYSKAQATQILKSFFDKNPVSKFSIDHEGTSKNNDIYKIGTLQTKGGNYRVTFFLKNDGGRFLVKELRIEKAGGF